MNIREFYEFVGGNYEDVLKRMVKEERVVKFVRMFERDPSYQGLVTAMDIEDYDEAFRMAHTLKRVCQNLGLGALEAPCNAITEMLREPHRDVELAKSLLPDVTKQYEHTMEGVKSLKE